MPHVGSKQNHDPASALDILNGVISGSNPLALHHTLIAILYKAYHKKGVIQSFRFTLRALQCHTCMLLHYDWSNLIIGVCLITLGVFGLLAIYNPVFGVFILKEHHPSQVGNTAQQKRLTIGLAALSGTAISFGFSLLVQFITPIACIEPQLVSRFQTF